YVPVDPDYPQERISYILADTNATIVITTKASREKVSTVNQVVIVEIDGDATEISKYAITDFPSAIAPNHLAYVIYTSGSTGKPKGVMIEHGSLSNYLINNQTRYIDSASKNTGTFIYLAYTFDASITGLFMPLLTGKTIVIGSKDSVEVFEDPNFINYAPYDFLKVTPSHLQLLQLTMQLEDQKLATGKLVIGGEALHSSHFDYFVEQDWNIELINEYGPTEATVGCTTYSFHTITGSEEIKNGISIGKPIDNTGLYILDSEDQLVPVGVVGEICIGGKGLARGYLNRPELTE
ncbi:MAG: AMP-binding protein, partial [Segetibacter sp.]